MLRSSRKMMVGECVGVPATDWYELERGASREGQCRHSSHPNGAAGYWTVVDWDIWYDNSEIGCGEGLERVIPEKERWQVTAPRGSKV